VDIVSCETKKGYSGVGFYFRNPPKQIIYGIRNQEYDKEGRSITAIYADFILVNTYFPNGGDRKGFEDGGGLRYKLSFYQEFIQYINFLETTYKKPLILTGDFNITHTDKDLARSKENKNSIGCLPQERFFLDSLMQKGYVDIWRTQNPDKDQYTWWDQISRARTRNVGWRIDYFFISQEIVSRVAAVSIEDSVLGSDHCPVMLSLL
jgi:exodeoxyribonuclease-3